MFGFTSPSEMIIVVLIIVIMWVTGLWPVVIRGIRELRGERVDEGASQNQNRSRQQSNAAPPSRDYDLCYKMLGISPSAPWEEVEKAYRRKAKLHHPDHGGDEDTMRALNEAYAQLKAVRGRR
ncbi:MAG TPA: J domain-containing protein [Candidatus Hydrogenedentes bacterium]|nr:J domain-containing protein [Candidatus Hydrogenedentota bacterium]HQE82362.1 J domain-containing protein [Candidatus Hydrogenedentota bacterium]HQH54643.1 J domain-containing protein [Candidatus Hydrogenedentota bacterium]HQM47187.1 J domain-containing protein [Candidatus Hydrogenedentota bacterium]